MWPGVGDWDGGKYKRKKGIDFNLKKEPFISDTLDKLLQRISQVDLALLEP